MAEKKEPEYQTLREVAETQKLADQRRKEHTEKYPECEKLNRLHGTRIALVQFIEELREKGIWFCTQTQGVNVDVYQPITKSDDQLVMEYLEIDTAKLEEERRAMLEALQEQASAAG